MCRKIGQRGWSIARHSLEQPFIAIRSEPRSMTLQFDLPFWPMGVHIPHHLHQTFPTRVLPDQFRDQVEALRTRNPGWAYTLHDDEAVERFITTHYGDAVLALYHRISPGYGAARADLFRYLLMYREGGIYLDIKSGADRPLDDIADAANGYLLSHWDRTNENRSTFGVHPALSGLSNGEYQQWHIVTVPGHPFLRAVILAVLANIVDYSPWRHGTGGVGTYRVTGPVAYTLAIEPLRATAPHSVSTDTQIGLLYNATSSSHKPRFAGHYLLRTDPIVPATGFSGLSGWLYTKLQRSKRLLRGISRA